MPWLGVFLVLPPVAGQGPLAYIAHIRTERADLEGYDWRPVVDSLAGQAGSARPGEQALRALTKEDLRSALARALDPASSGLSARDAKAAVRALDRALDQVPDGLPLNASLRALEGRLAELASTTPESLLRSGQSVGQRAAAYGEQAAARQAASSLRSALGRAREALGESLTASLEPQAELLTPEAQLPAWMEAPYWSEASVMGRQSLGGLARELMAEGQEVWLVRARYAPRAELERWLRNAMGDRALLWHNEPGGLGKSHPSNQLFQRALEPREARERLLLYARESLSEALDRHVRALSEAMSLLRAGSILRRIEDGLLSWARPLMEVLVEHQAYRWSALAVSLAALAGFGYWLYVRLHERLVGAMAKEMKDLQSAHSVATWKFIVAVWSVVVSCAALGVERILGVTTADYVLPFLVSSLGLSAEGLPYAAVSLALSLLSLWTWTGVLTAPVALWWAYKARAILGELRRQALARAKATLKGAAEGRLPVNDVPAERPAGPWRAPAIATTGLAEGWVTSCLAAEVSPQASRLPPASEPSAPLILPASLEAAGLSVAHKAPVRRSRLADELRGDAGL